MIQFLSLSTCIIYILDVQNLSPPRIRVRYKPLHFISSGFALLKIYRKNRNRNTNPDDGRDRHPVNQFRRRDVPDRVHFFRVDVFCFFFRERAQQQQTKEERERERVSQEREREIANTHTRPGVKTRNLRRERCYTTKNAHIPGSPGLPLAGADVRNPLVEVDAAVVVVRAAKRRKATIADILL